MSEITIDSEKIAEIKNALQVIQLNAEIVKADENFRKIEYLGYRPKAIVKAVKKIDKLLPEEKK